jgi:hypothetical protein
MIQFGKEFECVKSMGSVTMLWNVLDHAADNLKADKEFMLTAVTQCWWSLDHASEDLKDDREVVLVAVMQCGAALKVAPNWSEGNGLFHPNQATCSK